MPTPPRITAKNYQTLLIQHLESFNIEEIWKRFIDLEESPDNMSESGHIPTLDFSIDVASVNSSQIEGNSLDLNFFINSKIRGTIAKPKRREYKEIEDLRSAYEFAQKNELTEKNFLHCHQILSKQFLIASKRGVYRNHGMMIQSAGGIEYVAIEAEYLLKVMREFWNDVRLLNRQKLKPTDAFYHAALLHLIFVHIHPFSDGNGRGIRLLEKWFLAYHLGQRAWYLPSEAQYMERRKEYYANIKLGVNYYELDYSRCIPFLAMLPYSLQIFLE